MPDSNRKRRSAGPARGARTEILSGGVFVVLAAVLALWVFGVYLPSLRFQFILDDHRFLSDVRVQTAGHVRDYFTNYVWAQFAGGPATFYRPVFILWLRMNAVLCAMSPAPWHALSVVKHLAAAIALGWVVWVLLRDRVAVLIAAAFFALHPADAESVAWVTVPDPLLAIAVLLALLLYLRAAGVIREEAVLSRHNRRNAKAAESGPSPMWIIGCAGACLVAMFIKETGVVLPVVLVVVTVWETVRPREGSAAEGPGIRDRVVRGLWLTVALVAVAAIYLAMRFAALGEKIAAPTQHLSLRTILLSVPATLWFYVTAMLWPVRVHAFADPTVRDAWSVSGVLLPGLAVLGLAAVMAWIASWVWKRSEQEAGLAARTRTRWALWAGLLMLVLPMIPLLQLNALNPGDFLHGRYTYVSLAGLALLLATVWHVMKQGRVYLLGGVGALVVVFTGLTVQQESMWKDDLTVFTVAHEVAPHNRPVALNLAKAHVQEAIALGESGRCDEAVPLLEPVTREYPDEWYAWAGLGECLVQMNDLPRAEQVLHRAADLSGDRHVVEAWQEVRERVGASAETSRGGSPE